MAAALAAQEIGDEQVRDAALRRAIAADSASDAWKQLARWMQTSAAGTASNDADLDKARAILVSETDPSRRAALNYFLGRYLALCGRWDEAVAFLQVAAVDPMIRFSDYQTLACAALRDRGVKPGGESQQATPKGDDHADRNGRPAAK